MKYKIKNINLFAIEISHKQKQIVRILTHIFYWTLALFFYIFYFGHWEGNYFYTFKFVISLLPISMGTCYLIIYFLFPRYLFNPQKRSIPKLLYLLLNTLVLFAYLNCMVIAIFMIKSALGKGLLDSKMDLSTIDMTIVMLSMLFSVMLAVAIKLIKYWYREQNRSQQLLQEKIETELRMLKMQLNPHFLFNTLNSIYALSLSRSEQTPDVVLKLSAMLDYVLYECKTKQVELSKEVLFLQNYIELEKYRFADRVNVSFKTELPDKPVNIPPMMLMPFVENSFKHGAGKSRKQSNIEISLSVANTTLNFNIQNDHPGSGPIEFNGIGLKSAKKQLELMYPQNHTLTITDQDGKFNVDLSFPVQVSP